MINDDCVDSFKGPIQYNSDNSIKTYRILLNLHIMIIIMNIDINFIKILNIIFR